jgi:hypothetical protein
VITGGSAVHVTASGVIAETGGGILHVANVNTGVSAATLTLYDGTSASGAKIATISAAAPVGLVYDAVLNNGLYAAVSGAIDVTVVILPNDQYSP